MQDDVCSHGLTDGQPEDVCTVYPAKSRLADWVHAHMFICKELLAKTVTMGSVTNEVSCWLLVAHNELVDTQPRELASELRTRTTIPLQRAYTTRCTPGENIRL